MSKNADEECKKKRSPNFTGREKSTLLNLIYTYKSIIENKRTDAVTWREKEDAWAGGCSDAPVDESPMITEEIMEPSKSTPRESAVSEQRQENVNTSNFSANQLRKRISEPLEHERSKRRRPNIQQLNSSQLSEEYLKLAKLKQEYYENEKEMSIRRREKRKNYLKLKKKQN
ncbi:hypothetical protein JTB14_020466 [Gonioctena quinquepunctata]|nr:hypothetical protein JTB14_020466 [Gonioctena quinquepunctata]